MKFRSRTEAGRLLAARLRQRSWDWPIVLALPRGGLAVGAEIARALDAPLFPLVTRKLDHFGAVAEGGALVVDTDAMRREGLDEAALERLTRTERIEVQRRVRLYRHDQPLPPLWGRSAIVVDDGLLSGRSARAAARDLRAAEAAEVVLAVPVACADALPSLEPEFDQVIALQTPQRLGALPEFYVDFPPISDDDVLRILEVAREQPVRPPSHEQEVSIPFDDDPILATLCIPERASALIVFAPGAEGSRRSLRVRQIAATMRAEGFATLLLDLVTQRRDITTVSRRLAAALEWAGDHPDLGPLPVGISGTGLGAAAMLLVAAARPERVGALVSRGGRLELAQQALGRVEAPTLLIAGEHDEAPLQINRRAFRRLQCQRELVVIPGATHHFEEPGALEHVASLATGWFQRHLNPGPSADLRW